MSEIEEWLEKHAASLAEISRHSRVTPGLVHLAAVLILGGLDDERILAELRAHLALADARHDPLRDMPRVMSEIRELVTARSRCRCAGPPPAWPVRR